MEKGWINSVGVISFEDFKIIKEKMRLTLNPLTLPGFRPSGRGDEGLTQDSRMFYILLRFQILI